MVTPRNAPQSTDVKQKSNETEIKVFISHRDSKCDECGEKLGTQAWITLEEDKGALCLACADLDELVFLPTGDAALSRRSKKYSILSAVVLKFSRARRRYERQGSLLAKGWSRGDARSQVRDRVEGNIERLARLDK